jgi:hypothetical protein
MFATRATCPRATFIRVPSRSYAVGDNLLKSKAAECVLRDTSGQTIPVSQIFEGKKVLLLFPNLIHSYVLFVYSGSLLSC